MSNYNSLKNAIDANIKQNGNQEITGQVLNSVLNQMVTTLGAGYQFAGVATTATNPGSPDAKMFYIANGKGTYTNFGGLVVTEDDVVVLYWDSSWHKVSTGIASMEEFTSELASFNAFKTQSIYSFEKDIFVYKTVIRTGITAVIGKKYYVFIPSFVKLPDTGSIDFYTDEHYSDNIISITETNRIYEFTADYKTELSIWNSSGSINNFVIYVADDKFQESFYNGIIPISNRFNLFTSQLQVVKQQLVKLTVNEWNIGYWNKGVQHKDGNPYGIPNVDIDTYLPRIKTQLSKICSDILVLTEWVTYLDQNYTMLSYDSVLKQFYPYSYTIGNDRPAIFSKYPIVGSTGTFITDGTTYAKGIITIDEKEIVIVAAHLPALESDASRRMQIFTDVINEYANSPYVIFVGDTNIYNKSELQPFIAAGWLLGNCGYFGDVQTWIPQPSYGWYIDNVVTKGFNIDLFEREDSDPGAGISDHYPVRSNISTYISQ